MQLEKAEKDPNSTKQKELNKVSSLIVQFSLIYPHICLYIYTHTHTYTHKHILCVVHTYDLFPAFQLRSTKQQLKQDSETAHTSYQQQVKEVRSYQAKYEEGVKKNLDDMQELELKRIAKVRELLDAFVKAQEQLVNAYKSAIDELKKEITKINEKEDVDSFIKKNKTNQTPEEPVQYEPYHSEVIVSSIHHTILSLSLVLV
jgi:hypothetical protein